MAKDKRLLSEGQLRLCRYHGGAMVFDHIAALAEQLKKATEERSIFRDGLVGSEAELAAAEKRIAALEKVAEALDVAGDEYPERETLNDLQRAAHLLRATRGEIQLSMAIRIEHYLDRLNAALAALAALGEAAKETPPAQTP